MELVKTKYVQLEPAAFLTDIDFQMMTAEQRGVYCSIIFYLYCNNGQIELDDITLLGGKSSILASISACHKTGGEWDAVWSKIAPKFQINGRILTHKRVTEELKRAENYRKAKSEAGIKGMASRWGDNTDITKVSKVKESKDKRSKVKKKFIPPTLKEVIQYIQEKGYNVDARKFIEYYSVSDPPWHDRDGKPVLSWKQKLIAVWDKSKEVDRSCRFFYGKGKGYCGNLGVYTTTENGKVSWRCEQHKPKEKVNLPVPNPLKKVPQQDNRSVSNKVNEQRRRLGIK